MVLIGATKAPVGHMGPGVCSDGGANYHLVQHDYQPTSSFLAIPTFLFRVACMSEEGVVSF